MNYWNPYLETLAREELNKIELSYFRSILSFAKEQSILYREKLHDINPNDIRTLDDVKRIPPTEKEELRRYQNIDPFP
jgi:phenylacetate-CoA ligase